MDMGLVCALNSIDTCDRLMTAYTLHTAHFCPEAIVVG